MNTMTEKTIPRFRKVGKYRRGHLSSVGVKGYKTATGTLVKHHRRKAKHTTVQGHLEYLPEKERGQ